MEKNAKKGHTIPEYLKRIAPNAENDKKAANEREAYISALYYLNEEMEQEIKSRQEELSLLKYIKATIVRGLLSTAEGLSAAESDAYNNLSGGNKVPTLRIRMDMELYRKLDYIAKKEGLNISEYLTQLLEKKLRVIDLPLAVDG